MCHSFPKAIDNAVRQILLNNLNFHARLILMYDIIPQMSDSDTDSYKEHSQCSM